MFRREQKVLKRENDSQEVEMVTTQVSEKGGEIEMECKPPDMKQKIPYIEQAEMGTIVAFKLPNGKVKSAAIVKRSTKNRRLLVETEYDAQYIINYVDVIWVRTNKRWPKGVYRLLKGFTDDEEI